MPPTAPEPPQRADASTGTFRLRRSARARRLQLVVRGDRIELVIPAAVPETAAMAFFRQHRAWAEAKVKEFRARRAESPPPCGFCDFPTLPWRGRELPLRISEGPRVTVSADQAITIELPPALGNARHQAAHRAFFLWVKPRLTQQVATLAGDIAATLGTRPRAIRVKAMRSRWGSCGPANDININWLLALVPDEVLRYVVIHELCHTRERNHSAAFWSLVAERCPDFRNHRQWLRLHCGSLLQRFGPPP